MIIPKPICPEDMANFLYVLGFLGLCMYGYTAVSYNQILNLLKFWPTLTAVATAELKVKNGLDKRRWTDFCLKQLWIIGIVGDSNSHKKIKTSPQIRSIFGGTQICMCISKN